MFLKESTDFSFGPETEILGNEDGNLDIVLEATIAWHNLEAKMMRAEHHAIVTENHVLMEEVKETFWNKVKQFFIDLWRKIKGFYSQVMSMWLNLTQAHTKWLATNEAKVKAKKNGNDIQVKTYKYDAQKITQALSLMGDLAQDAIQGNKVSSENASVEAIKKFAMDELGLKGSALEFSSALHVAFRGGEKEAKEYKIGDLGGVGEMITRVKASTSMITALKKGLAQMEQSVKAAIKITEAGHKSGYDASGDEVSGSEKDKKTQVTYAKSALSVGQMVGSAAVGAAREAQVAAFKALKTVLAKGNDSFTGSNGGDFDILDQFA